jgi:hypothetical protein
MRPSDLLRFNVTLKKASKSARLNFGRRHIGHPTGPTGSRLFWHVKIEARKLCHLALQRGTISHKKRCSDHFARWMPHEIQIKAIFFNHRELVL